MSRSLCHKLIEVGTDICKHGTPERIQGFSAVHNEEWVAYFDVLELNDKDGNRAHGEHSDGED
jgi:hypothetical protein